MKSLFEKWAALTVRRVIILSLNLALRGFKPEYQIGKYGRMRRSYLKVTSSVLCMQACSQAERCIGTLPRSTKPAKAYGNIVSV